MTTPAPTRLIDDLNALHDSYVVAINSAIESGHEADTAALADAYDGEATEMVAVREGRTDLLPLRVRGRRR
jgi:hypothetical protein